jgi:hypothetical protein
MKTVESFNHLLEKCIAEEVQLADFRKPLPISWRKPRAICLNGVWTITLLYTDPRDLRTHRLSVTNQPSFEHAWFYLRMSLRALSAEIGVLP